MSCRNVVRFLLRVRVFILKVRQSVSRAVDSGFKTLPILKSGKQRQSVERLFTRFLSTFDVCGYLLQHSRLMRIVVKLSLNCLEQHAQFPMLPFHTTLPTLKFQSIAFTFQPDSASRDACLTVSQTIAAVPFGNSGKVLRSVPAKVIQTYVSAKQ